jgi:hypothetical protein
MLVDVLGYGMGIGMLEYLAASAQQLGLHTWFSLVVVIRLYSIFTHAPAGD